MKKIIMLLTISLLFVSGCLQFQTSQTAPLVKEKQLSEEDIATQACKALCEDALKLKWDLTSGPCLSENTLSWDVKDWVCDVAHSPREAIDNLVENQCPEFGISANHFVELDPDCKFIKTV